MPRATTHAGMEVQPRTGGRSIYVPKNLGLRTASVNQDKSSRQRMKEAETRKKPEKLVDELAREYDETHDLRIKAEIEELSLRLPKWNETLH